MFAEPEAWIWEYSTLDGNPKAMFEYPTLDALRTDLVESFATTDYTWEEVERRGTFGTSVLVKQYGRYVDTGHWVYRKQRATDQRSTATPTTNPQERS